MSTSTERKMTILEALSWFAVILFLGGYAFFLARILFRVGETIIDVAEKAMEERPAERRRWN